jgi:hypothetical protein
MKILLSILIRTYRYVLLLILFLGTLTKFNDAKAQSDSLIDALIIEIDTNSGFVWFAPGILLPGDAADHAVNNLSISQGMEMVLQMQFEDSITGHEHFLYRQEYQNVPVEGGEYMEHAENGYVYLAHGRVIDSITNSLEAIMSASAALDALLDSLYGYDLFGNILI